LSNTLFGLTLYAASLFLSILGLNHLGSDFQLISLCLLAIGWCPGSSVRAEDQHVTT
jgi:hypothetical protein